MNTLNRYRYHLIAALMLLALLFAGVRTKTNPRAQTATDLPKVEVEFQRDHALELFPQNAGSLALLAEGGLDMREFILSVVQKSLAPDQQSRAYDIARSVISEANHHGMDPLFLLAVITTESRFDMHARGSHGEVGLMQVLPSTAKWLAQQAGLPSDFNLEEPTVNIRIGATYMAHLRHTFKKRSKRYIAAYNMGSTNVRRLLVNKTEPEIYPARVINNYEQLYKNAPGAIASVATTRSIASVEAAH